jgi:hypothetical protein
VPGSVSVGAIAAGSRRMISGSAAIQRAVQLASSKKPMVQKAGAERSTAPVSSHASTCQWQTSRERSGRPA